MHPTTSSPAHGDNPRTFLETLSQVVQTGLTTIVWAGDADWICN
jgi:carboxypeptidase D